MLPPSSARLEKLLRRFERDTSHDRGDGEIDVPELRIIDDIVMQLRLTRRKDIPLPNKGQRFKVAQEVEVRAAVYLEHECRADLLLPVAMIPYSLAVGEVLVLPYQPDHLRSVACELIPERYFELEQDVVPHELLMHEQYVGYTFGVYYDVLYGHFFWL